MYILWLGNGGRSRCSRLVGAGATIAPGRVEAGVRRRFGPRVGRRRRRRGPHGGRRHCRPGPRGSPCRRRPGPHGARADVAPGLVEARAVVAPSLVEAHTVVSAQRARALCRTKAGTRVAPAHNERGPCAGHRQGQERYRCGTSAGLVQDTGGDKSDTGAAPVRNKNAGCAGQVGDNNESGATSGGQQTV